MGYRWYDQKNIAPRYPFGFGLSYTTFLYSQLSITTDKHDGAPEATVHFRITNTGKRSGDEIAQVYVEFPQDGVPHPKKVLKGFSRLHLGPGETKEAVITLGPDTFKYWHPGEKSWVSAKGSFHVDVAASSRDIRLTQEISLPKNQSGIASY